MKNYALLMQLQNWRWTLYYILTKVYYYFLFFKKLNVIFFYLMLKRMSWKDTVYCQLKKDNKIAVFLFYTKMQPFMAIQNLAFLVPSIKIFQKLKKKIFYCIRFSCNLTKFNCFTINEKSRLFKTKLWKFKKDQT